MRYWHTEAFKDTQLFLGALIEDSALTGRFGGTLSSNWTLWRHTQLELYALPAHSALTGKLDTVATSLDFEVLHDNIQETHST
jgi:hypothetical protein